jgi:WD40-like Beta Propeller Repeat
MSYGWLRTALVAASAGLVLLGMLVNGESAFAAYPGANGKIAYESDDGVDSEIFVMNADGSGQTNLINDPAPPNHAVDRDPAWSPDGTKIAFMRTGSAPQGEGHPNIYVMNADGTGRVNLTPGPEVTGEANGGIEPTWSPSGTHIAYNHSGDIWVMSASGGSKVRLEFGSGLETWPAWSPDGTKIAFIRGFDVWVGPATGGVSTQLTTGAGSEKGPDWSPDGSKIVYERSGHIWSMSSSGSGQTDHTTGLNENGTLPAWAPDGSKILFDSNGFTTPNGYDIFVMDADGTNETRIDTGPDTDLDPSWQPIAVPGGYPRPGGATPLRVSLVPAYRQCAASNRTHGPPLAFASCNPPGLESSQLTVGTPDANGAGAASTGFAKFGVAAGVPGGIDDSDVRFTFSLTDVRHQGGSFPDYTGELEATTVVRVTDRVGGPAGEAATVTDVVFPVTVPCTATSTAPGATCAVTTSFDAVVPGTVPEGKRTIWQLEQVRVVDGGADGDVDTTPNTLFAVQGVFVP